jgi:hypothetical protein
MSAADVSVIAMASSRDWLALGVAAYGAVVATGVAAYQFLRDRPGVRLIITELLCLVDRKGERFHVPMWHIRVVNHRKRPITIRSGGLLIGGRTRLLPLFLDSKGIEMRSPFPVTLTDGESVEFRVSREDHEDVCGAWATDALDRNFEVRHPSRNPKKRLKDWQYKRKVAKIKRKLEEH